MYYIKRTFLKVYLINTSMEAKIDYNNNYMVFIL